MDRLTELATFVAVVEQGGFAAASRFLRRSPPTITRIIADLEARVGVRLLERTSRRCAPTEAGRRLADNARSLLADYEQAVSVATGEAGVELDGVSYAREASLPAAEFIGLLMRSGLGRHRPIQDRSRIERMLANSNFIVGARLAGALIGVARGVTDVAWCCYVSDVAVDAEFQGRGIGRRLMEQVRREAGAEATCLLLALPDAAIFYEGVGMQRFADAFLFERGL